MEEVGGGQVGPFEDLEVIRVEAGMSTSRCCRLIDMPERTWRRWQAKARQERPPKGPWPQPARDAARDLATKHALKHPAWGHRKIWALTRHDGHKVSQATVLRLLRDDGLILPSEYQKQRRELAKDRKAAFARNPTGPNQVWQLDFSEFESTQGGTWRIAGCRDWYSKVEHPFHVSPTANQYDAMTAIELALADYEQMFGHPLVDECDVDPDTGELLPVVTIVTDNGGPFRSELRAVHHAAPRAAARPHPGALSRAERVTRTRVRDAEVRAAVPRRDPRRVDADRAGRGLPRRVQHRASSRGDRLEPADGGAPGLGRPHHPHL